MQKKKLKTQNALLGFDMSDPYDDELVPLYHSQATNNTSSTTFVNVETRDESLDSSSSENGALFGYDNIEEGVPIDEVYKLNICYCFLF